MATEKAELIKANDLDLSLPSSCQVGIIVSEWNAQYCESIKNAAIEQFAEAGVDSDQIKIISVPGSFELPFAVRHMLSEYPKISAILPIGCVIKGETSHDRYINQTVTNALMQISLMSNIPITLGLLTTENEEQAQARSGGKHGNKGYEWALATLKMISLTRQKGSSQIGFK